jgi:hypothetical protein
MHKLIFFAVKYFAFRIFLIKKTELIDPAFKGGGVVRRAFWCEIGYSFAVGCTGKHYFKNPKPSI